VRSRDGNNLHVYGAGHINEVIDFFIDENSIQPTIVNTREELANGQSDYEVGFCDVKGQENIKPALEIAAAGGHNAILIGPTGASKTMLADFLSSFILIESMNPCPCGYYNHPEKECSCPPGTVQKYLKKISWPLLDRIDLHVEVSPVPFNEYHLGNNSKPTNIKNSCFLIL